MPLLCFLWDEISEMKSSSEWAREQREAYRNLLPLLQAEQDRQHVRYRKVKILLEKEVMKDFPDWVPGENVYRTVDWMPPMPMPEDVFMSRTSESSLVFFPPIANYIHSNIYEQHLINFGDDLSLFFSFLYLLRVGLFLIDLII